MQPDWRPSLAQSEIARKKLLGYCKPIQTLWQSRFFSPQSLLLLRNQLWKPYRGIYYLSMFSYNVFEYMCQTSPGAAGFAGVGAKKWPCKSISRMSLCLMSPPAKFFGTCANCYFNY